MKFNKVFVLAGVLSLTSFAGSVPAQVVFGNGDLTSTISPTALNYQKVTGYANPFFTGNSSLSQRKLEGAWVLIENKDHVSLNFAINIYADGGSGPTGSALTTGSGTINASTLTQWQYIPFTSSVQLGLSSSYFISMEVPSFTRKFLWASPAVGLQNDHSFSGSDYSVSSGGKTWNYSSGSWSAPNGLLSPGFQLQAQAVPEPGSMILTGLALAGGGVAGMLHCRKIKTETELTAAATTV